MSREFSVVIERDEEGYLVASVRSLPGCHTPARSLDELMDRVREVIAVCLEVEADSGEASGVASHSIWPAHAGMPAVVWKRCGSLPPTRRAPRRQISILPKGEHLAGCRGMHPRAP